MDTSQTSHNDIISISSLLEDTEPEPLKKTLIIVGSSIGGILLVCLIIATFTNSSAFKAIELPGNSAFAKPTGEVQGAEMYGVADPPDTTPTPKSTENPTEAPNSDSGNAKPTDTPTTAPDQSNQSSDPTATPEPTQMPTPTLEPTESPTETPAPIDE